MRCYDLDVIIAVKFEHLAIYILIPDIYLLGAQYCFNSCEG